MRVGDDRRTGFRLDRPERWLLGSNRLQKNEARYRAPLFENHSRSQDAPLSAFSFNRLSYTFNDTRSHTKTTFHCSIHKTGKVLARVFTGK